MVRCCSTSREAVARAPLQCVSDAVAFGSARDVLLGLIEGCPFYVSAAQFPYCAHSEITVDVVPDGGDSFSLEAANGVRFITRSRVFADAEMDAVDATGPPPTGPDAMR